MLAAEASFPGHGVHGQRRPGRGHPAPPAPVHHGTLRVAGTFQVIRRAVSVLAPSRVRAYPAGRLPSTAFVDGLPERHTVSTSEYFQVAAPHASPADGPVAQSYRVDGGRWQPMPENHVFFTGTLAPGPHQVAVRTANRAGATVTGDPWQVDPMTQPSPRVSISPPVTCRTSWPTRST